MFTITMSTRGQFVLPKDIREAIGVFGRSTVKVEVVDNAARISAPESSAQPTARRRGRHIYTGSLPANWDSGEALLQIAVVLCSITLFTRKRTYFLLGLSLGAAGIVVAVSALLVS